MLQGGRPRARIASPGGPRMVGGSWIGNREEVEENRGHFVSLVSVEGGSALVDFKGFLDLPLMVTGFTGKHPHVFKREAVASDLGVFQHSRFLVGG